MIRSSHETADCTHNAHGPPGVATYEASGVNPLEYLSDVLIRVNTHPNKQIDELLPHKWSRSAGVSA
jgi:hypothetical protein